MLLASAVGCGLCVLLGIYFDRIPELHNLSHACYAAAFLLGGWDAAVDTLDRMKRFHLDIHFLMLAVAIGAAAIGSWWESNTSINARIALPSGPMPLNTTYQYMRPGFVLAVLHGTWRGRHLVECRQLIYDGPGWKQLRYLL